MEERDRGRLLANLESLPNEIAHLVKDLSQDDMRWRPIPGKWSIGEIVVHLRDVERELFQTRLRRSLYEDNPVFETWDQDRAAQERDYLGQDAHAALAEFRDLRAETVRMLGSVPLDFWGRVGVHPERGPATVEQQVVRQIRNHDLSHLVQIKDILRINMPW
jgi:hypothetical protein